MYKGQLWLETATSHDSKGAEFLSYFKGKAHEIFFKTIKVGYEIWERKNKSRPKSGLNDKKTGVSLNEIGNAEETGLREE